MKKYDRIRKKNISRLNRFLKKNEYRIMLSILKTLHMEKEHSVSFTLNLYNKYINNDFIREYYNKNQKLFATTDSISNIYIFVNRIIEDVFYVLDMVKMKEDFLLYKRNLIFKLAFAIYHEFYHIKEYKEVSEDRYLEILTNTKKFGYDKDSEKYANINANKLINKYIKYIFKILKI
ncbi:MAG: hypothetical protein M0P49_01835 [Bacilli bacterium]|nr:hypothetical protein [Bacilli bacterium]